MIQSDIERKYIDESQSRLRTPTVLSTCSLKSNHLPRMLLRNGNNDAKRTKIEKKPQ